MSTFLWGPGYVQYVLTRFDAGNPPDQILAELRSTGYTNLQLVTIEQCLRANNRPVDDFNPLSRPAFISNTFDAQGYQGQPINYAGDNFVRGSTAPRQPFVPPSNYRPQQGKLWDEDASRITINAHREGIAVIEIWQRLNTAGYVVNAAQVVGNLNAQGVGSAEMDGATVMDFMTR